MSGSIDTYVTSHRSEFEETLRRWVAIPTISASPEHRTAIRTCAGAVVDHVRGIGGEAAVVETPGNPVVLAEFRAGPDRPTVSVYNHLDVQPADEPEWRSDPFAMGIRDGVYTGRGTTDDKGPALTALMAARYAAEQGVPVNVRFIWELEEEIGSPHFESFVRANIDALRSDSVVVSDTVWISRSRPAMPCGLRGMLTARILLETGTKDVHSGLTGGAARNPVAELCALAAACCDSKTGEVRIPGFYDDVEPVSAEERDALLKSGFDAEVFRQAHGLRLLRSGDSAELAERIWTRPTFEVHGIVGGYTGPGVKSAIAPRAEAKISMRLVPAQSPARQFESLRRFVGELNPDAAVELDGMLPPYLGPREGPYADAARDAMQHAFGRAPVWVREGGSIGAVLTMNDYLAAPIVFLGLSLPEHGYHAPNEHFDWGQASSGMKMFVRYFENVSRI